MGRVPARIGVAVYRLTLTLQSVVSLALRRWAGGFLAGAALAVSAPVQAEELRLVTGELPPYATQDRADQGISLNAVRQAFALVGHTVNFTFEPWARALAPPVRRASTGKPWMTLKATALGRCALTPTPRSSGRCKKPVS